MKNFKIGVYACFSRSFQLTSFQHLAILVTLMAVELTHHPNHKFASTRSHIHAPVASFIHTDCIPLKGNSTSAHHLRGGGGGGSHLSLQDTGFCHSNRNSTTRKSREISQKSTNKSGKFPRIIPIISESKQVTNK